MKRLNSGPTFTRQMAEVRRTWRQGEHILVTGDTGSGKTTLSSHIAKQHAERGIFTLVMLTKLHPDDTIRREYAGFTRWYRMKKKPASWENKILLHPRVDGMTARRARVIQREVFDEMFDILSVVGKWTIVVDEALYLCDNGYLNLADQLKLGLIMGRSSSASFLVCSQRPSHIPLVSYSSVSHAFIGRSNLPEDGKRLAQLGAKDDPKALQRAIAEQGKHDFMWIRRDAGIQAEPLNITA